MATVTEEAQGDWVQYCIYPDSNEDLVGLRNEILNHIQVLLQGYIWQHEPFQLEVVVVEEGPQCLKGTTRFGDNIEDEWFVVYLLHEISRKVSGISITVRDNDGEFLLIEAAYAIPRWLSPDNSENRVFIREGCVHLIGPAVGKAKLEPLSVSEAVGVMKGGKFVTKASGEVQEAVLRRIKEYPARARVNMHKARCVVPLHVAHVLKNEPQLVSLAVDAFYRRDIDAMKAASKLKKFLSVQDNGTEKVEMVKVLVTMSRAMYAQLQQQVFAPPRGYPMPPVADPHYKEAELGMKLTCGFEMMYWEREKFESDDGTLNENGGSLKVSNEALIADPGWQLYRKSLENRGYFRGLLEGSRDYKQLLQAAIGGYRGSQAFATTSNAMSAPIKRVNLILSMPHTAADFAGLPLPESDNDSWLYDGEGDLTSAMQERQAEMDAHELKRSAQRNKQSHSSGEAHGLDQPTTDASEPLYDPVELVQGMQAFMNKISSYEGAELPDDEAVSLNMSRFMHELESALGMDGKDIGAGADLMDDDFSESDSDTESVHSDGELLFEESDSLGGKSRTVEPSHKQNEESTSRSGGGFMDEYSDALQHELQRTSLGKSFASSSEEKDEPAKTIVGIQDEEDEDGVVDLDMNLVTSLLQSYMNQEGMPGPASNLLGAMGIKLSDPSEKNLSKGGKR